MLAVKRSIAKNCRYLISVSLLSEYGYVSFKVHGLLVDELVGDHKVVGAIRKGFALVGTIPVVVVVQRLKYLVTIAVIHLSFGRLKAVAIGYQPQVINAITIGGKGFHWFYAVGNHRYNGFIGSHAPLRG